MNNLPRCISRSLGVLAIMTLAACQQAANPWVDELAAVSPVSTPSAEAARKVEKEPKLERRAHASVAVNAKDGSVAHSPLYFEDPTQQVASDDHRFAWTKDDYWQYLIGPGRFLASTAMVPVHAALTPPWELVTSHGIDHSSVTHAQAAAESTAHP